MIIQITTEFQGFQEMGSGVDGSLGYNAIAGGVDGSEWAAHPNRAAEKLANRVFGAGKFYFTKIREGFYTAEAREGMAVDWREPTADIGEIHPTPAKASAKMRSLKSGPGFVSAIVEMLEGRFQFVASDCPVINRRVFNRIRLDEEERAGRGPRGKCAGAVPLFPVNRDNMLLGRVCSVIGVQRPEEFFRTIERAYLRGSLQLRLV